MIFEFLVKSVYLPLKASFSRKVANDYQRFKRSLPKLAEYQENIDINTAKVVNEYCAQLNYVSDPLNGVIDYYNHPEHTQWIIEEKRFDLPYDCDDLAVLAVSLFRKIGYSYDKVKLCNLIISPLKQFTQMYANHVICVLEFVDTRGIIWTAVIDTNTVANKQLFMFEGNFEQTRKQIIDLFCNIYKVSYYRLIPVPDPFTN